jgi:chemotaxis methyl-accepting protein methylase
MNHNLTNTEFSRVCEVIASYTGLHFPIAKRAMVSRSLADSASDLGFQNMKDLINCLLTEKLNSDQVEILASNLPRPISGGNLVFLAHWLKLH